MSNVPGFCDFAKQDKIYIDPDLVKEMGAKAFKEHKNVDLSGIKNVLSKAKKPAAIAAAGLSAAALGTHLMARPKEKNWAKEYKKDMEMPNAKYILGIIGDKQLKEKEEEAFLKNYSEKSDKRGIPAMAIINGLSGAASGMTLANALGHNYPSIIETSRGMTPGEFEALSSKAINKRIGKGAIAGAGIGSLLGLGLGKAMQVSRTNRYNKLKAAQKNIEEKAASEIVDTIYKEAGFKERIVKFLKGKDLNDFEEQYEALKKTKNKMTEEQWKAYGPAWNMMDDNAKKIINAEKGDRIVDIAKNVGIGGLVASGGIGTIALAKGLHDDFSKKEASELVEAIYKEAAAPALLNKAWNGASRFIGNVTGSNLGRAQKHLTTAITKQKDAVKAVNGAKGLTAKAPNYAKNLDKQLNFTNKHLEKTQNFYDQTAKATRNARIATGIGAGGLAVGGVIGGMNARSKNASELIEELYKIASSDEGDELVEYAKQIAETGHGDNGEGIEYAKRMANVGEDEEQEAKRDEERRDEDQKSDEEKSAKELLDSIFKMAEEDEEQQEEENSSDLPSVSSAEQPSSLEQQIMLKEQEAALSALQPQNSSQAEEKITSPVPMSLADALNEAVISTDREKNEGEGEAFLKGDPVQGVKLQYRMFK